MKSKINEKAEIRIVIPAKRNSKRAPGKNRQLLPLTLDYVERLGLCEHSYVMTSCPLLTDMARERNVQILPEYSEEDDFASNFVNSYQAAGWRNDDIIALLEPTKPFRQAWLLAKCIERYADGEGNVVTTGSNQRMTFIEWSDGCARRHTGLEILDSCIVIARCADFLGIASMSQFWDGRKPIVVWHDVPTGVDFDYPFDLRLHLPTAIRESTPFFHEPLT